MLIEISKHERIIETLSLTSGSLLIGRGGEAQIKLEDNYVSANHARLSIVQDVCIEDLDSYNGTYVNGQRLDEKTRIDENDTIQIGEFHIRLVSDNGSPETRSLGHQKPDILSTSKTDTDALVILKRKIHRVTIERMKRRNFKADQAENDAVLRATIDELLDAIIAEVVDEIPHGYNQDTLKYEMLNDILGLGPLELLIADTSVSEIMVNGWDKVYCERNGKLQLTDQRFIDNDHVLAIIQRIVGQVGRAVNESQPMVDARLKDGSRVNAIIPPLALNGPTLTIRKFAKTRLTADDLLTYDSLSPEMVSFLELAVRERKNIVISGGTGSGKTTLLNILSNFIPNEDRIITVEDAAELQLNQDHIISLESRPENADGAGAIRIRKLVINCLRMRPDRIVVGECRGEEALDMLQAMNTGHDGSLTTAHANSPRDVLSRLETMVLMSGMDLPIRAIRDQISSAIDLVVQQSRLPDGSRKVTHITEITGIEDDRILTRDIFRFAQKGFDSQGKVKGDFCALGVVPDFVKELQQRGIAVDLAIYHPSGG